MDLKNPKDPIHEFLKTHSVQVLKPQMATGAKASTTGWMGRCGSVSWVIGKQVLFMNGVEGFMYPNEVGLQWSVLIVLYPFITGLGGGRIHSGLS